MKPITIMILSVTTALVWFSLGYNLAAYDIKYKMSNLEVYGSDDYNTSKCFEINDVETASLCLRDWVKGFYNYTVRDDTIKELSDIKSNGGDCYDYTMLYKSYLDSNGYITEEINIYPGTGKDGHSFLIAYDKSFNKYCKLDQLYVDCLKLGGSADYEKK